MYRRVLCLVFGLVVAGCASAAQSPTTPSPMPSVSLSKSPSPGPAIAECGQHQAPELEAVLPAAVMGRDLDRWSTRGTCWRHYFDQTESERDAFLAGFETPDDPRRIDLANITWGLATLPPDAGTEPTFVAYGVARPQDADEISLALWLLFSGTAFRDPENAGDLARYDVQTIADRQVYVGAVDLLQQTAEQGERPYLYQNDDYLFLVITDDDGWASDAIGQLPN